MTHIQCSICLDDVLENENSTRTSCGHVFHKNCLESWINQSRAQNSDIYSCPLCRSNITENHPIFYYWNGTSQIKMFRNKDVEVRYYPNNQIKYRIYINTEGDVDSGDFFDSDGINKINFNQLDESNDIHDIRNNDYSIIIF